MANNGVGSPCGACKFLRRKCAPDCLFAPYFCSEQGPARFAAIHKVFGASNVSKLLVHIPVQERCEAVATIAYEAEARLSDPVFGCVAHILALQQQVAILQAQLMQVKAQLASNAIHSNNTTTTGGLNNNSSTPSQWQGLNYTPPNLQAYYLTHSSVSPQSSIESTEHGNCRIDQEMEKDVLVPYDQMDSEQKKLGSHDDDDELSQLHELAFKMMRD